MKSRLHIIYIPGLGDNDNPSLQRRLAEGWSRYGVESEFFQMSWADQVPWESKFKRLLKRIDDIYSEGDKIGLVGASAGASAVINAYAARKDKISGCVLIAGKVNRPNAIGARYRKDNPSFVESAYECEKSLAKLTMTDKKRILSRYGLIDETVYRADSVIPGAINRVVPMVGHVLIIGSQLILGAPSFIKFLKRLSA